MKSTLRKKIKNFYVNDLVLTEANEWIETHEDVSDLIEQEKEYEEEIEEEEERGYYEYNWHEGDYEN